MSTISINNGYVRVYPLRVDSTPSNYNSFFPERTGNNSLKSTIIYNDNLNEQEILHNKIHKPHHIL